MIDTILLAIIAFNTAAGVAISVLLNRNAIKSAVGQWKLERKK